MKARYSYVLASAPATVANVGPAFDVLGFALSEPSDEVEIQTHEGEEVVITSIEGDGGRLSRVASENTVTVPILAFLQKIGTKQGLTIRLKKNLPLGSGLGSSAASAAAGVVAVNALFGNPLSRKELVPFAMEGEKVACGTAHADNVAPSILGEFVLIRSYSPLDLTVIPSPKDLFCTVICPSLEVRTEDARKILPREVPLQSVVTQLGNVAGLLAGIITSDIPLLSRSLEDIIVEPPRSTLIKGYEAVKATAKTAGALGCCISGSGPSLFAFSTTLTTAQTIGEAMAGAFEGVGLKSRWYASSVNREGAQVKEVRE